MQWVPELWQELLEHWFDLARRLWHGAGVLDSGQLLRNNLVDNLEIWNAALRCTAGDANIACCL